MTSKIMAALVTIVVGLALTPIVVKFADELTKEGGDLAGTTAGTLVGLLPILFVLILVAGTIGYVYFSRREK